MCPVCGKKVGAWHKSGIHPKCQKRTSTTDSAPIVDHYPPTELAPAIASMTQADRDRILRRMKREKS